MSSGMTLSSRPAALDFHESTYSMHRMQIGNEFFGVRVPVAGSVGALQGGRS